MEYKITTKKTEFPFLSMEPFLILDRTSNWDQWSHPRIADIYESLPDDHGGDVKGGSIMKFDIFSDKGDLTVLCLFSDEDYENIIQTVFTKKFEPHLYCQTKADKCNKDVVTLLQLILGEDFWCPDGEQFCKNNDELAQRISDIVWDDNFSWRYSPDVGLNALDSNDKWCYST